MKKKMDALVPRIPDINLLDDGRSTQPGPPAEPAPPSTPSTPAPEPASELSAPTEEIDPMMFLAMDDEIDGTTQPAATAEATLPATPRASSAAPSTMASPVSAAAEVSQSAEALTGPEDVPSRPRSALGARSDAEPEVAPSTNGNAAATAMDMDGPALAEPTIKSPSQSPILADGATLGSEATLGMIARQKGRSARGVLTGLILWRV